MTQTTRDIGGQGGLGDRRYERYCAAFDRVEMCVGSGYSLEAIAILDSLIWDRLASRLGYVTEKPVQIRRTSNQLCNTLIGDGSTSSGAEKDSAFRTAITDIKNWMASRNEAVHAMAKVFRANTSEEDFTAILQSHKQAAIDGIRYLQNFDRLDTECRAKMDKRPASYPNAFFPKLRMGESRRRSQSVWNFSSIGE